MVMISFSAYLRSISVVPRNILHIVCRKPKSHNKLSSRECPIKCKNVYNKRPNFGMIDVSLFVQTSILLIFD